MRPPRPDALRLFTCADGAKPPKPPFGLRAWSPSADAVALFIDARRGDMRTVAGVTAQVPPASTLPSGSTLIVLGTAAPRLSLWRLIARGTSIPRAARCTALLARGYIDIGAGTDEVTGADLAWGAVP